MFTASVHSVVHTIHTYVSHSIASYRAACNNMVLHRDVADSIVLVHVQQYHIYNDAICYRA